MATARLAPAETGIAHTRWATHGRVTEENAHPHDDSSGKVHIVLNGIVENHAELRKRLIAEGEDFTSETDAEVVAHLIAHHYDGDLAAATRDAYAELRGHYAFVAMHADEPHRLLGARKECPLVAGVGEGETFLASAIPAFLADTRVAVPIENGELVEIEADEVRITDTDGNPIERAAEEVTWDAEAAEKGGYETFMLKEIHEQADAVAETITDRLPEADGVDLSDVDLVRRVPPRPAADRDRRLRHQLPRRPDRSLRDRGMGAGAGRNGHRLRVPLPQPGGRPGRPGDRHHPVRRDRRHAGRDAPRPGAGAKVLAVTNIMGSQATRDADAVLYTRAGLEIGVAATKTFLAQVAAMYLLGLRIAELRGSLAAGPARRAGRRAEGAAGEDRRDPGGDRGRRPRPSPSATSSRSSSSTSAATSACRSASRGR